MAERAVLNIADRVKPGVFVRPAPRQVYRFEAGGKRFVYDANAMTLAVGGGGDEEWASPFRPDFPHPPIRDHADTLVLCLTRACNLRCQYCFVRHGDGAPSARMTPDMARRALDLLLPPHGPATVALFGGEPLLESSLLTEIVEYARHVYRGPGRPGFHLTTNGTLLDAGKAAFLDREGFDLIVSLDGPRDIHNQSRPGGAGVDSYDATLRGLRSLKGLRLSARTTLRGTFAASGMRLRERLEHHHRLLDEGLAAHVSLEPVSLTESGCGAAAPGHPLSFDSPAADWGAVEAEYGQAAAYVRDRIRQRRAASFEPLVRFTQRLAFRQAACSECQAGNGTVSVAPDGRVYACHREGPSAVGSLAAGGLEESLRAPWLDPRFYLNARCMECPIRLACGGPCRLDALERGDLHAPPDSGCKLRHAMFRWAAWLLSELTRDETARLAGQRASTCYGQKG